MKQLLLILTIALFQHGFSQTETTIRVMVPEKTDTVYIAGNQESMGNWQPDKIKMEKVSDREYQLTLPLIFPAEFKFTGGSWDREGILKNLDDNPNVVVKQLPEHPLNYIIKNWSDAMTSDSFFSTYTFKTIPSKFLGDERAIKVFLPEDYQPTKKYPTVYVTDASYSPNFEIALQYLKQLYNFEIIPQCILIGINQKNRNQELDVDYTENGHRFKDYIFEEVVPFVDSNYATSGFNVLIGHSDGATFNHILMVQPDSPFRGYISISDSYFKDQLQEVADFNADYNGKNLFYFVASGEYDSEERFAIGTSLDSLFEASRNEKIHFRNTNYKADHNDLVGRSLLDGIQFIFKDYQHLNNYDATKELIAENTNPLEYWKSYSEHIRSVYGVNLDMNFYDFEFILELAVGLRDKAIYNQTIDAFPKFLDSTNVNYYSFKAQDHERMGFYEDALAYWKKNIEEQRAVSHLFAYRRPYQLLVDKLHRPKDAIAFLEYAMTRYEKGRLELNYYLAKTAVENNIEKRKAKQSILYCENNYVENDTFTREMLHKLKQKLK